VSILEVIILRMKTESGHPDTKIKFIKSLS